MPGSTPQWRVALLVHPLLPVSVATLAVNDHVLKGHYANWWTGKLSDLAGLVVVGMVATIILGRSHIALGSTAAAFIALKTLPIAAVLAAPTLGGLTRTDPTDLIVLPALFVVDRLVRRVRPATSTPAATALVFPVALVTFLAVTATSCYDNPGIEGFVVQDSVVWAYGDNEQGGPGVTAFRYRSDDGGATFVLANDAPARPARFDTQRCSDTLGCFDASDYEIRRDERVVFSLSESELGILRRHRSGSCGGSTVLRAPAVVSTSEGEVVLVASGQEGAVRRSPDGTWSRIAVADHRPSRLSYPQWLITLRLAPLLLLVLYPLIVVLALRNDGERRNVFFATVVFVMGSAVLSPFALIGVFATADYDTWSPVLVAGTIAVATASVAMAIVRPRRRQPPPPPTGWSDAPTAWPSPTGAPPPPPAEPTPPMPPTMPPGPPPMPRS